MRDTVQTQYLAYFFESCPKSFHGSSEVMGRCRRKHVHSISHHTLINKSCGPTGNLTLSDLLSVPYLHACRRVYVFSASDNGYLISWVHRESITNSKIFLSLPSILQSFLLILHFSRSLFYYDIRRLSGCKSN